MTVLIVQKERLTMPTNTTAFVLGGGGSHGDFEVGALQYFYQWALTPDIICGNSVGSLNGVKLAEGENAPGSGPSGLAGLAAIWNSLQVDSDMWYSQGWQGTDRE
jgi:NTE family protein